MSAKHNTIDTGVPDDLHAQFPIGTLVHASKSSAVNRADEVGVVYAHYARSDGSHGVSIVFESGGFDGWSRRDLQACCVLALTPPSRPHPQAACYSFSSTLGLSFDYHRGEFAAPFTAARALAYERHQLH